MSETGTRGTEWLGRTLEEAIEPEQRIVDPHHHLLSQMNYGLDELRRDLTSGHRVVSTVYLEAHENYDLSAPPHLQSVGETRSIASLALQADKQATTPRMIEAIIANVDLAADTAGEALDAHVAAGEGRLRGVRAYVNWTDKADTGFNAPGPDVMSSTAFRNGVAKLAERGLGLDLVAYHTNLPGVADLAAAFPEVPIIVNHTGIPLQIGGLAGMEGEVRREWLAGIERLAAQSNVFCKLGGLANVHFGVIAKYDFEKRDDAPSSAELAEAQAAWIEPVIAALGPKRCMFESNFPVDSYVCNYVVLWNSFKIIAADYSQAERDELFCNTAARAYRLNVDAR